MYGCPEKKVHEQLQARAREQLKQTLNDLKTGSVQNDLKTTGSVGSELKAALEHASDRQTRRASPPRILNTVCILSRLFHKYIHTCIRVYRKFTL